jgi:hypothetical protein
LLNYPGSIQPGVLLLNGTSLNSGDWVENMTSLEYTPGEWKIFRFNAKDFPVSGTPGKRPDTTVVTGGIMVHLNP